MLFSFLILFFFTATATTEIYTLSLHDALPILVLPDASNTPLLLLPPNAEGRDLKVSALRPVADGPRKTAIQAADDQRSEEHTSELQSLRHLVCRLLLEKKKKEHNRLLTAKYRN